MVDVNEVPKPWWASKTIWGSAAGVLALGAGAMGLHVDEQTKQIIVEQGPVIAAGVAGAASTILTVWGRLSAKRPIG